MRGLTLALLGTVALAGCEPLPAPVEPEQPPADACDATAYQGLIGQPRSVLAQMTFPIGTRQIGPDDAVTADFRPDRMNIEYSRAERIEKVSCY